jgi:hypothetical protein
MGFWQDAPMSLRIYVLFVATAGLVFILVEGPILVPGVALELLLAYFLLRRVRWLWRVAVGLSIFFLLLAATRPDALLYVPLNGIGLALLLLPSTRRYFDSSSGYSDTEVPTPAR